MDGIISTLRAAGPNISLVELGPLYSGASVECGKLLHSGSAKAAIPKLADRKSTP